MDCIPTKDGQIPSLNGWRAVAIILVMLDHAKYSVGFPSAHMTPWTWVPFDQGLLGVRMFFVLSGFLITHLLLRESERTGSISLKNFYIRRSLRILPVYVLYLGVLALLLAAGVYAGEEPKNWIGVLTFTRNMIGPAASYTGHFWSLAVEEQFYLLWPISLALLSLWCRPRLARTLLLLPIVICPLLRMLGFTPEANGAFVGAVFGGKSILVYADSLAVGCLGAFLARHPGSRIAASRCTGVVLAALVVIAATAYWNNLMGGRPRVVAALIPSLQAAAILLAMWASTQNPQSFIYQFLNWRVMNGLGILSYSLYVWHVQFLCNVTGPSLRALLYDWRTWWIAAIVAAAASYYGVERPILRLKKRFTTTSPVSPKETPVVAVNGFA